MFDGLSAANRKLKFLCVLCGFAVNNFFELALYSLNNYFFRMFF
jgi:hypothetical protein